MARGLTISQAAAFAGVTVKTVRHYHRLGLVDEPHRDSSDYRRYGSAELTRLLQVRTLAEAGVPLARIGALLCAEPQRFAAELADIKQRLTKRIDELVARRDTLERLTAGNRLLPSDRVCALMARAAELGFAADFLAVCQEGLTLAKAMVPDFDDFLTQIEHAFNDARYMALLKRSWEARAWEPHDPRVEELAATIVDHLLANPGLMALSRGFQSNTDDAIRYGLVNDYHTGLAPAVARLSALIETKLRLAHAKPPPTKPRGAVESRAVTPKSATRSRRNASQSSAPGRR